MNLGVVYGILGNWQRSRDILERALQINECYYGPKHLNVVITLERLANAYGALGDVQKACESYERLSKIKNDYIPLDLAVCNGYLKVVAQLLEKGADPLLRNHHDTVLHQAVSGNNVEIIKLILDAIKEKCGNDSARVGQAINVPDTEGDTPLMWAAEKGKVNAAQILLEYGADINAENEEGMTALNWAAKNGHLELAVVLLNHNHINVDGLNEDQRGKLIDYIIERHQTNADSLITKLFSSKL
jgi:ankyrin repeat protein